MAEPDGLAQAGLSAIPSKKVRPSTCCEAAVFSYYFEDPFEPVSFLCFLCFFQTAF